MKEILNQIKSLHESLTNKNDHYTMLLGEVKTMRAKLDTEKASLDATARDLAVRGEKIGVIENANAVRIEAAEILKKAQADVQVANDERKKISDWIAEQKRLIERGMKDFYSCDESLKVREKVLADGLKKLAEDRKTYKNDVLKQMDK